MHCRVGSQRHPPELISRFPSLSSDITQLVGLRDTCPLSRRHRGALALKGLPFIRSGRCATPLHASLQIQSRTHGRGHPPALFVAILLWQLYIHSRESFKIKIRTKQTYRISSSPPIPHRRGSTRVLPSPKRKKQRSTKFLTYLSYIVNGFKHRTTIPFDHIVLQAFQTSAWREPPGRP
jgi:hypothetical protein